MSKQIEDYELCEVVGEGEFGKVHWSICLREECKGSEYAIKVIKSERVKETPEMKEFI